MPVDHQIPTEENFTYKDFHLYECGNKTKKPVLFLHGAGSNYEMWSNHLNVICPEYYCIAPDLPGHGKSNHLAWTSIENVGDELAKLIKSKTDKKISIIGFSLGGNLTYYLLENYPGLIERAIIDGASAYPLKGSGFLVFILRLMSPFIKSDFILNAMAKSLDLPEIEYSSFKKSFKNADRRSFKISTIQANQYRLLNKDFTDSIPVLYASGEKESKSMHDSHVELSNLNNESICLQYPKKGHAWMVSDMETHISMIYNWIKQLNKLPDKLKKLAIT